MDENKERFLEIGPLISGEAEAIPFDRTFDGDWEENGISFRQIRFSGSVTNAAGLLRLSGTAFCELASLCARCLAPVREELRAETVLTVVTGEGDEDTEEDFVIAAGEKIDLLEAAEDAVLPSLPFRLLCREDCKGLCPVCGKDLNEGECGCVKKAVDPRLAGLADFFKK